MAEGEFVCCSVIEFSDGGEESVTVLERGSKETCERVADLIPAVSYSGKRPMKAAYMVVTEAENLVEVPA